MAHGTAAPTTRGGPGEVPEERSEALRWPAQPSGAKERPGNAVEVALLWGDRLLEVRQFRRGPPLTLGHLPRDGIHLFARSVGTGFALWREAEGHPVLRVPYDARFAVYEPGGAPLEQSALEAQGRVRPSPKEDALEVTLSPGDRAVLALGALRLAIRPVKAPGRIGAWLFREWDFAFFKLTAICLMAACAFLVALSAPGAEDAFMDDSIFRDGEPAVPILKSPPPPPAGPVVLKVPASGAPGEKAPAVNRTPKEPARPRTAQDALKEIFGASGPASLFTLGGGPSVDEALKNLGGPTVAQNQGMGGPRGDGPSARGPGFGFNGLPGGGGGGPVGITFPPGRGTTCIGNCTGIDFGGSGKGAVRRTGRTQVVGGLDRAQIARVIRQHQSEIRYCYESALSQDPDLSGKVAVRFVIDGTGSVYLAEVAETSLGSAAAQSCIVDRIRSWRFPPPRGGGEVEVHHPWSFRPAGAE